MPSVKTPQLINVMREIATMYFRSRRVLVKASDQLSDSSFHAICSYIYSVLYSYTKLPIDEKRFINNEFFYAANDGWWKSSLTLNEYKKVQKESIEHFLTYFYEVF